MARICFYISSHGFGHATREMEILSHLPNHIEVEIITGVPKWLFSKSLDRPFIYTEMNHDSGIIQQDSFNQDVEATYARWQTLLDEYPAMAKREAHRLKNSEVALVVGDISPFSVLVAHLLNVPSVMIANFSWDWIFTVFLQKKTEFQNVIDRIASIYAQTDLLLRTPLSDELNVFPKKQDIPLVVRCSQKTREEARREFGIAPERKAVLISFGGMGFHGLKPELFEKYPDHIFLSLDPQWAGIDNVIVLDAQNIYHPDAVNACDVAMAKLGYGMVTECIAHQTPIIYPPRFDFPEHEILEREIKKYVPAKAVPADRYGEGAYLGELIREWENQDYAKTFHPTPNLHGGHFAAEIFLKYCSC